VNRRTLQSFASRSCLVGAVTVLATVAAFAQAPARPAAAPTGAPQARPAGGPFPSGRVAIINIAAFTEKVAELKRAIDGLNRTFETRTKDLQAMRDQISGIENQVKAGGIAPAQQAQLSERYDSLKREYQRKSEDLTAEAQKAYQTSTDPIRQKLSAALDKYAADHQIVLVIEVGGAIKAGSIFYAAENTNITDDFIATYNKANP
jgi:outer membrane protein